MSVQTHSSFSDTAMDLRMANTADEDKALINHITKESR